MSWPVDENCREKKEQAQSKRGRKSAAAASFPPQSVADAVMKSAAPKRRGDYNAMQIAEMRLRMRRQLGKVALQSYDESDDNSVRHWCAADKIVRDMAENMASRETICARLMEEFPDSQIYNNDVLEQYHGLALLLGNEQIERKANEAALHLLEEGEPVIVKEFLRALHPQFRANQRVTPDRRLPADVTPEDSSCRPDMDTAALVLDKMERLRRAMSEV